jgi:hypothetical protein
MSRSTTHSYKLTTLTAACIGLLALTAVQAQTPPATNAAPPAASAAPGAAPAAPATPPAAPGALRPMKDFLRDAKASPGFFTLHQKDDKIWLEILPSQLNKPFFFSYNIQMYILT